MKSFWSLVNLVKETPPTYIKWAHFVCYEVIYCASLLKASFFLKWVVKTHLKSSNKTLYFKKKWVLKVKLWKRNERAFKRIYFFYYPNKFYQSDMYFHYNQFCTCYCLNNILHRIKKYLIIFILKTFVYN